VNRCFMCKAEAKSLDCLPVHCPFARARWNLGFSWLRVSWVVCNPIKNHLFAWQGFFGRKAEKNNPILLPHAIFGAFGVKEIEECLRAWGCLFSALKTISLRLCIFREFLLFLFRSCRFCV